MPSNKNASLRYRILDRLFRQRGAGHTIYALIEEVSQQLEDTNARHTRKSISERQLREDIKNMRAEPPLGFAAPIDCIDGLYKYNDHRFSINQSQLTRQDKEAIEDAIHLLRQFEGLPHFLPLENYLARIEGAYLHNKFVENTVWLETNPLTGGLQWLKPAIDAIRQQQVLSIEYHPFDGPQENYHLHPYLIKEFRNRWFLYGRHEATKKLHWLTFDRIWQLTIDKTIAFEANDIFDPHLFFDDIIGVTLPDDGIKTQITLEATPLRAHYLRTKPLHRSQTEIKTDQAGIVSFSLDLIPNFELYADLAAMAHDLRVVSPDTVRLSLNERLQASLAFQLV
jgi:predicted DNA-binding transcriptional regulator YafY